MVCYADDTIILAKAIKPADAVKKVRLATAMITNQITKLSLKIAPKKTDAMWFHRKLRIIPPLPQGVEILGDLMPINRSLKYLDVVLDDRLSFKEHFAYTETKANLMMRALWRIMPNMRGPDEAKRSLYAHAVQSVLLYAAPVWVERLESL